MFFSGLSCSASRLLNAVISSNACTRAKALLPSCVAGVKKLIPSFCQQAGLYSPTLEAMPLTQRGVVQTESRIPPSQTYSKRPLKVISQCKALRREPLRRPPVTPSISITQERRPPVIRPTLERARQKAEPLWRTRQKIEKEQVDSGIVSRPKRVETLKAARVTTVVKEQLVREPLFVSEPVTINQSSIRSDQKEIETVTSSVDLNYQAFRERRAEKKRLSGHDKVRRKLREGAAADISRRPMAKGVEDLKSQRSMETSRHKAVREVYQHPDWLPQGQARIQKPATQDVPSNFSAFDLEVKRFAESNGFTDIEKIGRGRDAIVYRVKKGEKYYALKVCCPNKNSHLGGTTTLPKALGAFKREVAAYAELSHKHILGCVGSYSIEDSNGECGALLLPWAKSDLRAALCDPSEVTPEKINRWVLEFLRGLSYMHAQGFIHMDLRPDNLLITANGHLKIADFGVHRRLGKGCTTQMRKLHSTCRYIAPELKNPDLLGLPTGTVSRANYDHRVDVYSFGKVVKKMASAKCLSEENKSLLNSIVAKATKCDATQRWSAANLLEVYGQKLKAQCTVTDM